MGLLFRIYKTDYKAIAKRIKKKITWNDIYELAFKKLGLQIDEFEDMPLRDFIIRVNHFEYQYFESWRHTRALMQVFTGKDLRQKIPLPGDYDYLQVSTPKERIELAERFGMQLTDEFKQKMLNGNSSAT